jgi:intracellular septation protein
MNRYLPQQAIELVPDIAFVFGFIWSGLMFLSAVVNIVAALQLSFLAWTGFMSAYALSTKLGLFLIQYVTMRAIAMRRHRAAEAVGEPALAQA